MARRCRAGCTIDATGQPNRDPARSTARPRARCCRSADTRATGCRCSARSSPARLTGGLTTNPRERDRGPPRQQHAVGRLRRRRRSAALEAFKAEIARMAAWVKASPPVVAGGEVLLPGEIERRTRVERERDGVPLDAVTRRQIADGVRPIRPRPADRIRGMNDVRSPMYPIRSANAARRRHGVRRHGVRFLHAGPRAHARRRPAPSSCSSTWSTAASRIDTIKEQMRVRARCGHRADGARAGVPAIT